MNKRTQQVQNEANFFYQLIRRIIKKIKIVIYLTKQSINASINLSSSPFPNKNFLLSISRFAKYGHLTVSLLAEVSHSPTKADAFDMREPNCTSKSHKSNAAEKTCWKKLYQTTVDIMQQLKHAPLHLSSVKACSQQIWMDELDHNQHYRTSYCHPPAYSLGNAGNIPSHQGCQMKETKLMAGNGRADIPSIASERTK